MSEMDLMDHLHKDYGNNFDELNKHYQPMLDRPKFWYKEIQSPSTPTFPSWILEILNNVKDDQLSNKLGYYLWLLDGTLEEMGMDSPSYFIDEEEEDIEFLWENDRFRLLLNFDLECSNAMTILRIKSEKGEQVIEIEADPFATIQHIRRLVVPFFR